MMATTTAIKRHAPTHDNTIIRMITPLILGLEVVVLAVTGRSVVNSETGDLELAEVNVEVDKAADDDTRFAKDVVVAWKTVVVKVLVVVEELVVDKRVLMVVASVLVEVEVAVVVKVVDVVGGPIK